MRITGLSSGLDMDEIVKNSMKPYRVKIDKKTQEKEILEIKQKLYREVIKDSRELYNKYFDITKNDSILLNKNWATAKFTSSNENLVSITSNSDAKPGNYTVSGVVAKASSQIKEDLGSEITVNGKTFIIEGSTDKEKAINLNKELRNANINVSVRYTDFAGTVDSNKSAFIFESTVLGKDNNFIIGGILSDTKPRVNGEDSIPAEINGLSISKMKDNNNFNDVDKTWEFKMKIDGKELNVTFSDIHTNEDIKNILNKALLEKGYKVEINNLDDIKIISINGGKLGEEPVVEIINKDGSIENAESAGITFEDGENATSPKMILDAKYLNKSIMVNGINIDLSKVDLTGITEQEDINKKNVEYINQILKEQNSVISSEIESGNIFLKSSLRGKDSSIEVSSIEGGEVSTGGEYAKILIKNDKGGIYTHEGISNTVTLDGVTFKLTGDITAEGVSVNGKQSVTDIKDNLVKFFNDYNTLVEKFNKLTTEKRNRDFVPLTADQKKEMSEDEIKLWNEKVQKGQLSKDSDLSRISNSLKQAMRTLVDGTGLNLDKIGISPVGDYSGTKNGTYTIDETKLTKALEENTQEIIDMFIKSKPDDKTLSDSTKYSKTGIFNRIKDVLYNEAVTVKASLLKKAGIEGSSTSYNNEITLLIEKYEQKMVDMEKDFSRREQALYSKYASLESIMNKYNSQQSYLSQQLGLS